jgi:hypothetical protein
MLRRALMSIAVAITLPLTAGTVVLGTAAPASATETRQFRGEGDSGFGPSFALIYARWDAQRQADQAGFGNCHEIESHVLGYSAYVIWECTR